MIIGPYINSVTIILGGLIGAYLGGKIPERLRNNLTLLFGLCSVAMGVVMLSRVSSMPAMIFSLLIGTIVGEILSIEHLINRISTIAKKMIERLFPQQKNEQSQEAFLQTFVGLMILFSFSGTGIFGAMHEGLVGDSSILIIKSSLDFFTAIIFATTLGISVCIICIPQITLQLILAYLAVIILPLITPEMKADFGGVGGAIMIATGLRICNIRMFSVANMLPSLFIAMPISALWLQFV
ncbi:DUF554 domain-containing protein [Lonepinella koalarum]|uniref:Membrane protein YdfK n=1 Tax=Lonepinella koalarum TaxID=53417 RepID=A0A4R1KWI2_9PAST|nr:DUF554 domain-containing protein [Lonepinella koalarum]MDH2926530.1 hypothetical protein [Lonepinella koalarum]TCK69534.1 hypothetical protein EV692_1452 [Lonepinella koalarum]TFJ89779.1 DUF554 domain-containing protein [Lonepinella koalarum]